MRSEPYRTLVRALAVFFLAVVAGMFSACDVVDLDGAQPETSVSLQDALSDQTGFEGLLVSMYDRLQGTGLYGQQYMLYPDALADNAQQVPGSSTNRYASVFQNVVRTHMGGYGGLYDTINEANQIITNIDGLGGLPDSRADAIRNRIEGEARFLRGLAYFDLVRIYSYMPGSGREVNEPSFGVPLRLAPTVGVPEQLSRTETPQDIYDQIVTDFERAEELLTNNEEVFNAPARINAGGVAAYLSRVHLYLENYSDVEAAAGRALSKTSVSVVDAREGAFGSAWASASHPESIFELTMTPGQDATGGGSALQDLTFFFGSNFAYEVIPSNDVVSIFADSDIRNTLFATDPSGNTYLTKYSGTRGNLADRIPLMRASELYLNRAEARAESNAADALGDLNFVRVRRGLDPVTGLTGQELVDEVLEERRREFLFEGKRFFDLKRKAMDIPKPNTSNRVSIDYNGPLSESRLILAPLPNGEVQSNPLIEQNPGY